MSNPKVSEFDNQSVELEGWIKSQLSSNSGCPGCPYGKPKFYFSLVRVSLSVFG